MLKKKHGFFDKFLEIFKTAGISQIALQCNWNSENSQNVDKIGVFWKKFFEFFSRLIFFLQKNRYRYRIWTNMRLKIWKFPKRSNLDFLKKRQMGFSKKRKFLKITKGRKFGVECNWISKISQNIRKLAFAWKKKRLILRKKILSF